MTTCPRALLYFAPLKNLQATVLKLLKPLLQRPSLLHLKVASTLGGGISKKVCACKAHVVVYAPASKDVQLTDPLTLSVSWCVRMYSRYFLWLRA